MTRREFASAVAAAGLLRSSARAAIPFPVHFARPNPYDQALSFLEPGSDEFAGEKIAIDLERRLARVFKGSESAPPALQSWMTQRDAIQAARFYVLPDDRVRFEIKVQEPTAITYHTGVWKLPDFTLVAHHQETAQRPYFRDVTSHTFGADASFQKQLLPGNLHWRTHLDSATGIDVYGNQGIAVGDIDNDGIDEVYVCQPGGLPNRLYKIHADGTAHDITDHAGLNILDDTTSALFADFRNSGLQDLILLRASGPLFFLNQGDGTFREQPDAFRFASKAQGSFTGMAAADYNRDGRLDLYLCCYVYFQSEDQYQFPAPYHDAQNGPPNFLFRNRATDNGMIFEDVTATTGINENNNRFSFAPAWCDLDGDGFPDLYVANDFGRNNFYRNRKGQFRDEAAKSGVEDMGPGMSASWFDYDGDGHPDLYVSNMWTAPGQRVVRDPAFKPAANNAEAYRRHTKGNSLYHNLGNGAFAESTGEGVEMGRWAWGSGGFDWDLDGTPEILVATAMMTNPSDADVESFFWRQVVGKTPQAAVTAPDYENGWSAINQVIRQDYSWAGHSPNVFYVRRGGKYEDASGVSGLDFADDTRSFAVTDFDGDGNLDVILKSRRGPQVRAMQNDCTEGRPAIAIRLVGVKSNRDAIGARIEVNGRAQHVQAGSGFLSQHSKQLHFGLLQQPLASVKILWPSGATQELTALEPGFTYTITEGKPDAARRAFRKRSLYPDTPVSPLNEAEVADTWLLEPVPTPVKRKGPGFVLLHAGEPPAWPSNIPLDAIDVSRQKDDVAASFALFRRYLFEYRAPLAVPLLLLIDAESRARKVYGNIPSADIVRNDLAQIDRSQKLALPFAGTYIAQPRRNYFKLGAAFYWAGYPARALPYIAETLRTQPENWRAWYAAARIQQETGHISESLSAYQKLLQLRPNYPPALVGIGQAYVKLKDPAGARGMFDRALAADAACADAMNQIGLLAAEADDSAGARQWFERAIAAQRDHSGAINNLGVLYARLGQQDDSIAAFLYGIRMAPDDETLYLNLGRIYVTMGQQERARGVLKQLLERKPGDPVGTRALAELEGR
jgi:tetratricopeptide (TPR) repeat protein